MRTAFRPSWSMLPAALPAGSRCLAKPARISASPSRRELRWRGDAWVQKVGAGGSQAVSVLSSCCPEPGAWLPSKRRVQLLRSQAAPWPSLCSQTPWLGWRHAEPSPDRCFACAGLRDTSLCPAAAVRMGWRDSVDIGLREPQPGSCIPGLL